jgi:hypothetical protein
VSSPNSPASFLTPLNRVALLLELSLLEDKERAA